MDKELIDGDLIPVEREEGAPDPDTLGPVHIEGTLVLFGCVAYYKPRDGYKLKIHKDGTWSLIAPEIKP